MKQEKAETGDLKQKGRINKTVYITYDFVPKWNKFVALYKDKKGGASGKIRSWIEKKLNSVAEQESKGEIVVDQNESEDSISTDESD